VLARGDARVDLDRHLGVGEQREARRDRGVELRELVGVEVGRRAAAPVHLGQRAAVRQLGGGQLELAVDVAEVARRDLALRRRDDVAAAVGAVLGAERNVDVEAERHLGAGGVGPAARCSR
jgi:hypothetical protein